MKLGTSEDESWWKSILVRVFVNLHQYHHLGPNEDKSWWKSILVWVFVNSHQLSSSRAKRVKTLIYPWKIWTRSKSMIVHRSFKPIESESLNSRQLSFSSGLGFSHDQGLRFSVYWQGMNEHCLRPGHLLSIVSWVTGQFVITKKKIRPNFSYQIINKLTDRQTDRQVIIEKMIK